MLALLTDFGDSEYLGQMKAVIYAINPFTQLVDLSNSVKPQNIREGAWMLSTSFELFPKHTVFLCVVDPGVGGKRKAIAIQTKNYFFVGPNNGLMWPAAQKDGVKAVRILNVKNASKTFHGRDVFARAAALLESGVRFKKLGTASQKKKLEKLKFFFDAKKRIGEVVKTDHFGNIITNLPHRNEKKYLVELHDFKKKLPFYETYEKAEPEELFLVEGSASTLEISKKGDSAAKTLKVRVGEHIIIK